jgi:acetylornithine deacetylase/succinyl-diaminopimelate desuccinylase family protein
MDPEARIKAVVAGEREAITSTLAELIAIPTENPPGTSYRECADFLSRLLGGWGIEHQVFTVPHGDHPRFSIVGSYGAGEPGLHFHGHYDVVSAQSPDQFRGERRNSRLYGRGAADMKGGIVAMLFALRSIQQCDIKLSKSITLTLVPDEETGGRLGMRRLVDEGLLPRPAFGALMPEPSSGAIWNGCRGALTLRVRVKGKPAHGALPHQGINAFEGMVRVMNSLLDLKQRVVARRTALPITPPEADRSVMVLGGGSGSGLAFNVVPESAWFSIERRINPEEALAQVKDELNRIFEQHRSEGLNIEVETFQESEACVSPADAGLGRVLAEAVKDVTGTPARFELCPGVLETRFFCHQGIPGYGYGPGLLEVAHGPDEHVDLDALFNCTIVYALTAARLLALPGSA